MRNAEQDISVFEALAIGTAASLSDEELVAELRFIPEEENRLRFRYSMLRVAANRRGIDSKRFKEPAE